MALLLVQIAFASQAVEAKIAMLPRAQGGEEIFPETLAMARMIGGALFFQALASTRGRPREPLDARTHVTLFVLSLLGISVNQTLFLLGLRWTSPFAGSLMGATIPVFTAGLAALFGKERFVWRTGVGLALSVSGVLWLTGIGSLAAQDGKGVALLAVNCLSYSAYVVLSRGAVLRLGAARVMAWLFTYGALAFSPLGVSSLVTQLPELSARGWGLLAFILFVPTILAYGLNAWALGRSSATLVTVYIYLQPLVAGVLARVQLGHRISPRAGLAAVLILGGLGVVVSRKPARVSA